MLDFARQSAFGSALLAAVLLVSSCTTVAGSLEADRSIEATSGGDPSLATAAVPALDDTFTTVPSGAAYIARPKHASINVYSAPDTSGPQHPNEEHHESLQAVDLNESELTLSVIDEPSDGWVHVRLAKRPNFSTGWVRVDDVNITWTTLRIVVDTRTHTLTLLDGDERVVWGTVAIGTATTPTPTGETYVSELLASNDPDSLYGPFALGLAMFSEEVTEYAGGNGQIAIHGTNRPELLGTRASLGCVRTHNDLISELAGRVPLGTPVTIL